MTSAKSQVVLPREMGVSVTASKSARSKFFQEIDNSGSGNFPTIDYTSVVRGGALHFVPKLITVDMSNGKQKPADYLEKMRSGGTLGPTMTEEYCVSFPALDVKLTNNTKMTQFFTEAVLEVKSSIVDRTPLPLIFSDYDELLHMVVMNDGWGVMNSLEVTFQLTPQRPRKLPESLPFRASFSNVKDKILVEMGKALEATGVEPEYIAMCQRYRLLERQISDAEVKYKDYEQAEKDPNIRRLQQLSQDLYSATMERAKTALKPFELTTRTKKKFEHQPPYECWASGRLIYTWLDELGQTQTQNLPFESKILLVPPEGLGAPAPVSGEYQTMLRPSGANYTLTVPITQAVKKGEVSRFLLTLGIPATSRHEMVLQLRTTDGKLTIPAPLNVHGFLPRSAVGSLSTSTPKP